MRAASAAWNRVNGPARSAGPRPQYINSSCRCAEAVACSRASPSGLTAPVHRLDRFVRIRNM